MRHLELTKKVEQLRLLFGDRIMHPWSFTFIAYFSTEVHLQEQLYERNLKRRLQRCIHCFIVEPRHATFCPLYTGPMEDEGGHLGATARDMVDAEKKG